jgi:hypothetical protein
VQEDRQTNKLACVPNLVWRELIVSCNNKIIIFILILLIIRGAASSDVPSM